MKNIVSLMLAALLLLPYAVDAKKNDVKNQDEIKVMSYNIRVGTAKDGTNSWLYRCSATIDMINDELPDVIGIQEALGTQLALVLDYCKDYRSIGVGRDDGRKKGEYMAVLYNKKTLSVKKSGTFWLSETPDKPSQGWDAACRRTATWALMTHKKTGSKFYIVNTHLDHVGTEAREKGLELIMERLSDMNKDGYPVVLTGDFNMTPEDKTMAIADANMKSARKYAANTDYSGTFNGWGKASKVIDYIYYRGFNCPQYRTVTKKYGDRTYISDHYPIVARLTF